MAKRRSPTASTSDGPVRRPGRFHAIAASRIPPKETVGAAQRVFSSFDRARRHHGLEKIKTIGDAYMVVGGLPVAGPDHPERAWRWPSTCSTRSGPGRAVGRPPGPDRHPHRAGGGRRHRHAEVHLRPLGRHGQHREPAGVARHTPARSRSATRPGRGCAGQWRLGRAGRSS